MIKINATILIARPMEEVFAFLTDLEKLPQWAVGVVASKQTSQGPRGVGTTYQITGQVLGRKIPSVYQVTQFEAPRTFGGKNSGLLSFEEVYTLENVDSGTHVTQVAEIQPQGFFKLLTPLMRRALQQQLNTDFANLKRLIEAGK